MDLDRFQSQVKGYTINHPIRFYRKCINFTLERVMEITKKKLFHI